MKTETRIALGALLAASGALGAQSSDSLPNVSALRAPSTPAFVLLGISPTDVARPQTPADLAASFVSKLSAGNGVAGDVTFEASPYWLLFRHTKLTWRDDTTRTLLNSFLRTLAVSLGTTQRGDETKPSTALGLGGRAMLLSGRLADTTIKLLTLVEGNSAAQGGIFNKYRKPEVDRIDALMAVELRPCAAMAAAADRVKCATDVATKYKPMLDAVTKAVLANVDYQKEIAEAEKAIDNFTLTREGWFLEVAGGAVWDFANGAWAMGRHTRTGGWATLSHEGGTVGAGTTWTPIVVGRYIKEDSTNSLAITDVGGRIVVSGPQYSISAELVHRFWSGTNAPNSQHRLSGMVEYKIRDDAWLFGAIGKDYADATKDSFITKFGLSLSLKKQRYTGKD